ncbi:hypothetical protein Lalb_Chr04g0263151 [Lupinus albus]|uniref:Uncharacterized protein n=1 Tax=Lupinus albus TaxID=3870 RepID=A0A6A4QRX3_LUPAL|nr:hypothetical protein Lalb_Chr04g0263151 [Lupinus albus]
MIKCRFHFFSIILSVWDFLCNKQWKREHTLRLKCELYFVVALSIPIYSQTS